jgi:hypothetical protein
MASLLNTSIFPNLLAVGLYALFATAPKVFRVPLPGP